MVVFISAVGSQGNLFDPLTLFLFAPVRHFHIGKTVTTKKIAADHAL